jgi:hypothetical protein
MAVDEPLHINREPARLTAAPKGQLLQDEVNEAMTILFAAEGRQWKPDVNRLLPPQVSEATPTDPPARKRPSRGKRKKFKFPLTEEDRLALVREWEEDRRRNR